MEAEDPTATVVNPCLSGMLEAVHEAEEFLFNKMEEKTKEIKVLENNDIESLVTEKKEILKEIIDLKTKISLYDENCENEQKGIDSSAEENDQMVMRKTIELKRVEDDLALLQGQYMIRKQELEEAKQNLRECRVGDQLKLGVSQNWTLEQSQSELAEREYFKHHAKTPSGRNTFTEMQDNPSSGEIQPKITPSTPQTFTRNPAPPTPMEYFGLDWISQTRRRRCLLALLLPLRLHLQRPSLLLLEMLPPIGHARLVSVGSCLLLLHLIVNA
ncbi:uncharacterized protein [Macrobrachium rosenbergii]|uniref:uncharacterized protein isoform X2 n=1 Tax=Macrobrachium rosenbergii TaxID=79674 RepID=UPI0034D55B6B